MCDTMEIVHGKIEVWDFSGGFLTGTAWCNHVAGKKKPLKLQDSAVHVLKDVGHKTLSQYFLFVWVWSI